MTAKFRKPVHPGMLMVAYWFALFAAYLFFPIHQTPSISLFGMGFLLLHVAMFVAGSTVLARVALTMTPEQKYAIRLVRTGMPVTQRQQLVIGIVLSIGILGGLLSIYGKLSLVGEYSLSAIANLRMEKAQDLLHAGEVRSGLASIIAFFLYPAGFVGLVATLLRYEWLSFATRFLAGLYICVVFILAVLAGGRSPVLVALLFLGIASYVRSRSGLHWLPASLSIKVGLSVLLTVFVAYSSLIWAIRSSASGLSSDAFLMHAETVWGVRPSDSLILFSEWLGWPELIRTVMSTVYYLTQSLSVTERILDARHELVPLLGGYQIDLLAGILRTFPAGAEFLARGNQVLLDANVYGFFAGAWGALFIDMGYWSVAGALIWGYLAGRAYRGLRKRPGFPAGTTYAFWIYSILISFVSAPFGFSNAFMTFLWFVIFRLLLVLRVGSIQSATVPQ